MAFTIQGIAPALPNVEMSRQEFANYIISNTVFTLTGSFGGIQFGGTEPTSNIGIWIPAGASTFYFWNNDAGKYLPAPLVPTGTIAMYGGSTAPGGWLNCDGSTKGQSQYPQLFAVIGYNYSLLGDDNTPADDTAALTSANQFRLPDYRGRVAVGMGQGTPNQTTGTDTLTNRAIGQRRGKENVIIGPENLPTQKLPVYEYLDPDSTAQSQVALYGGTHYDGTKRIASVANDTTDMAKTLNMPPFLVSNFIIRT